MSGESSNATMPDESSQATMSAVSPQVTMSVEGIRASVLKQSFLPMEVGRIIKDRMNEKTVLLVVTADLKATWRKIVFDYEETHGTLPLCTISDTPPSKSRSFTKVSDDYPHGIPEWIKRKPENGASSTIITRVKKTAKIEVLGLTMSPKCDRCTASGWDCYALGPYEHGVKCARCNYAGQPCTLAGSKETKHKEDQQFTDIVRTAIAAHGEVQDQTVVSEWQTYVGTL